MTPAHVLGVLGASCVAPLDDADHLLASLELPDAPPRAYPNQLDLDATLLEDPVRALGADSPVTHQFLASPHSLHAFVSPMPHPIAVAPPTLPTAAHPATVQPAAPLQPVRTAPATVPPPIATPAANAARMRPAKRARADSVPAARSPKRTRRARVKPEPTAVPTADTTPTDPPLATVPSKSNSCPMMGQLAARVKPEATPAPSLVSAEPTTSGPQVALSRRAQRVMRTREAATRNRMEQRAKMTRLKDTNERLCRQSSDLLSENLKLRAHVQRLLLLKANPAALRRVLDAMNARVATV